MYVCIYIVSEPSVRFYREAQLGFGQKPNSVGISRPGPHGEVHPTAAP